MTLTGKQIREGGLNSLFSVDVVPIDLTDADRSLLRASLAGELNHVGRDEGKLLKSVLDFRVASLPVIKGIWENMVTEITRDPAFMLCFAWSSRTIQSVPSFKVRATPEDLVKPLTMHALRKNMVFTCWQHAYRWFIDHQSDLEVDHISSLDPYLFDDLQGPIDKPMPSIIKQIDAGLGEVLQLAEVIPKVFRARYHRSITQAEFKQILRDPAFDRFLYELAYSYSGLADPLGNLTGNEHKITLLTEDMSIHISALKPELFGLFPNAHGVHTKIAFTDEAIAWLQQRLSIRNDGPITTKCPAAQVKDPRGFSVITGLIRWVQAVVEKHYMPLFPTEITK